MNAIGGYFELELRGGEEYHKNAIRLNSGRNALELILIVKQYRKVFIPYYMCDVILEPFNKLKIEYEFYSINEKFEPLFNYDRIKENESFLYTNYFGLKDSFISTLSMNCRNLIIDNSQAFYALPKLGVPTFYSCRKFFGVPDGAYLYLTGSDIMDLPTDVSLDRFMHLLKRIEYGPEEGYNDFKNNDQKFIGQPIRGMSCLTQRLLKNIDYETVAKIRKINFNYLHNLLGSSNNLELGFTNSFVPLAYPFISEKGGLRSYLIQNNIYMAQYWPNVLEWCKSGTIEMNYSTKILSLPIDQRYLENHMQTIIDLILNYE